MVVPLAVAGWKTAKSVKPSAAFGVLPLPYSPGTGTDTPGTLPASVTEYLRVAVALVTPEAGTAPKTSHFEVAVWKTASSS